MDRSPHHTTTDPLQLSPEQENQVEPVDSDGTEKETGSESAEIEIDSLHEKISTLSQALSTVSAEKSKMEAAFQGDRKLAIVRLLSSA